MRRSSLEMTCGRQEEKWGSEEQGEGKGGRVCRYGTIPNCQGGHVRGEGSAGRKPPYTHVTCTRPGQAQAVAAKRSSARPLAPHSACCQRPPPETPPPPPPAPLLHPPPLSSPPSAPQRPTHLVLLLQAADHAVNGCLEVGQVHGVLVLARRVQGRLVAHVGDVGARHAGRQGGQPLRVVVHFPVVWWWRERGGGGGGGGGDNGVRRGGG